MMILFQGCQDLPPSPCNAKLLPTWQPLTLPESGLEPLWTSSSASLFSPTVSLGKGCRLHVHPSDQGLLWPLQRQGGKRHVYLR